jgi:hypothetical protein
MTLALAFLLFIHCSRARGPRRGVSRQRRTGRFATDSVLRRAARGDGANDGARAIGRTPSALVGPRSLERSAAPAALERSAAPAALERSAASNGVIDNRSPHPKTVTLPRVNQLCLAYARAREGRAATSSGASRPTGWRRRCADATDPIEPPGRRCACTMELGRDGARAVGANDAEVDGAESVLAWSGRRRASAARYGVIDKRSRNSAALTLPPR